jgi:hypothetical protein
MFKNFNLKELSKAKQQILETKKDVLKEFVNKFSPSLN